MIINELYKPIDLFLCKMKNNRENPVTGIYKITSPSGKINIGQSIDIENRFTSYRAVSCKKQTKLYHSFKKHGVYNHVFEIVHICTNSELNNLEQYYITHYNTFNTEHGLNLTQGGGNIFVSDEARRIRGESIRKDVLPYIEAKTWVIENLKSINTQAKWKKITGQLPSIIPKDPQSSYKNNGWISWGDFLGTNHIHKGNFLSYEECKKWIRENELTKGISNREKWRKIIDRLPEFIPKDPITYYSRKGTWKSCGDFFNTNTIAPQYLSDYYYDYDSAKEWIKENIPSTINTQDKWKSYTHNLPIFIPKSPQQFYNRKCTWISWGHFLENGRGYGFLSYNEAKEWINTRKFKGMDSHTWKKNTHSLPSFIPKDPYKVYKRNDTWINWCDFVSKNIN